jgi:hypothetical protein
VLSSGASQTRPMPTARSHLKRREDYQEGLQTFPTTNLSGPTLHPDSLAAASVLGAPQRRPRTRSDRLNDPGGHHQSGPQQRDDDGAGTSPTRCARVARLGSKHGPGPCIPEMRSRQSQLRSLAWRDPEQHQAGSSTPLMSAG